MIKRILLCLMAVLFLSPGMSLAEDSAVNLLKNPGFEELDDQGMPVSWVTEAYVNRLGVTEYTVTEDAKSGQHSVKVSNYDMNDARFAQTVQVEPNTMYRLSGWIKAEDIFDAGRGANLSIGGGYFFSDSLYDTEGEWVYLETYGITDDDQHEVTVFVRVGGYSGESQGTAYFDDISLTAVQELPSGVYAEAWYNIPTVQSVESAASSNTGEAQPFWPWLIVMACLYAAVSFWLMRHLQLDRSDAHLRETAVCKHSLHSMPVFAIAGLVVAGLLRILIALNVDGYQVDVNCFTAWGNTMANVGPVNFYQSNWCDYTPGYIHVMGLNGIVAKLLNGIVSTAFVHKLLPMACDLLAAWLIYRLAFEHGCTRRQGGMLALLMAFNPAMILNSAAWCQIDSVLCVGLMLVAYFALHRKWSIALPMYVLCILVKPQALMLGFLGLSALIMEWIRHPDDRKMRREMGIGLLISIALALVIIIPFCPRQESFTWLFQLYGNTLASYPYATVNTANLFYLAGANWSAIETTASTGVIAFFCLASLGWAVYTFLRQKDQMKLWYLEPLMMFIYAVVYLLLAVSGCTWLTLGVATMSMAFAIVLPMFIRSGKLEHLSLCGAVIFLLLYVFGIKMHERYLFPALFLLGMAYAIRRDRRILGLLIGTACVLFVNEGVILDNSLRLGSSMGHLNADNVTLANFLSVLNVAMTLLSAWTCHRICVEDAPLHLSETLDTPASITHVYEHAPCTPLNFRQDAKLNLNRKDALLMLVVTLVYSVVTLTTLGSTKAPQNPWKSSAYNEYVTIDLGQHYENFSMLYFSQVSYKDFDVSVRDKIYFEVTSEEQSDAWTNVYPAEMKEGMCFSWQYLDPSYISNGAPVWVNATDFSSVQKLTGRYVRIDPKQVGLILNEVIFKDADGNIIPNVTVIDHENANENSVYYSDPANLFDEQDTLEGEPGWWNSTYFDEIYHARTAFEHMEGTNAYEWTHPPLGKVIMSWFVALFGMTPFGWRFAGALCGILMLPAMYLLAKQLTKRTDMAFVAMMLMTLDCMHFTQTRLATIDSYPVLFIILSYFFMLRFMQRDVVLEDVKTLLPDLAMSGFFMGCGFASKWIGAYAGIGLAVLFFWTCFRHLRIGAVSAQMLANASAYTEEERMILEKRLDSLKRIVVLCMWCLLFFVTVPLAIYLLSYVVHFSDREFTSVWDFLKTVYNTNFGSSYSMLWYHGQKDMGADHFFASPWYEWPLMAKPMYYASAAFKPEGMTYAIFCFGNPWVWLVGLAGIAYTAYRWARGHCYRINGSEGSFQLYRNDWDITFAFLLIGLLAQFLPWLLVPRSTFIYHYFASVPFLILGTTLMLHYLTMRLPKAGKWICGVYLLLCLIWFILLFPYASGMWTPNAWMDFIRDYPYISTLPGYWENDFLVKLNSILEVIPIFPNVYHH